MTTVLKLSSSIYGADGESSRLAARLADELHAAGARVIERDLAREPVPHLDAARFQALLTEPGRRTPEQRAVAGFSDRLVDELRAADVVLLGLPMYNFGVPSQLKAYFDHVARAGVTFRYTASGPEGLLKGKKAYVFATRGGHYRDTAADSQTAYVRHFLGFLGVTDVEFVYAEGLALGAASKDASLARAQNAVAALAEPLAQAA